MKILMIDTSTNKGLIALFDDKKLIFCQHLPSTLQNSKSLFPALVKHLQDNQPHVQDESHTSAPRYDSIASLPQLSVNADKDEDIKVVHFGVV